MFCLCTRLFSQIKIYDKTYDIEFELGQNVEEIKELIGDTKDVSVAPFEQNHNWDTICWKYNDLWFWYFRGAKVINKISIANRDFKLIIDDKIINNDMTLNEIQEILKKNGSFLLKNDKNDLVFLFDFPDFTELHLFFDEEYKLQSFLLAYQEF